MKKYYLHSFTEKRKRKISTVMQWSSVAIFVLLWIVSIIAILLNGINFMLSILLVFITAFCGGFTYLFFTSIISSNESYFFLNEKDELVIKRYKRLTQQIHISRIKELKLSKNTSPDDGYNTGKKNARPAWAIIGVEGSILCYVVYDSEVRAFFESHNIPVEIPYNSL